MCFINILKHPVLNFVFVKCNTFITICFDICYNTFGIYKLILELNYYIKFQISNLIFQNVNVNLIQISSIFLFEILKFTYNLNKIKKLQ